MKFDLIKNAKKILIASLSVLLIGIIMFAIFNFNLGVDFKGYSNLTFEFGVEIAEDKDFKEVKEEVKEILTDNGAKILLIAKENSGIESKMVIQIEKKCDNNEEALKALKELAEKVEANYPNIELYPEYSVNLGTMTNVGVAKLIYSITFAFIVVMVYLLFRLRLLNTICVMAATAGSLLVMFALLAITRVPVNASAFGIITVMSLLTMIFSTMMLSNIKNEKIEFNGTEDANKFIFKNSKFVLMLSLIAPMLLLLIFGTTLVRSFALVSILAIVSLVYTLFVLPIPLYYVLNNFTQAKVKAVKVEEVEEEVIEQPKVVEVEKKEEIITEPVKEEQKEEVSEPEEKVEAEEEKTEVVENEPEVKEEKAEEAEIQEEKKEN